MILQHGLGRMVEKQENVFYYLTLLNENYAACRACSAGTEERDHQGHVPAAGGRAREGKRRASTCSAAARSCARAIAAAELLEKDWGVAADVWSCPSFNELRARRPWMPSAGTCCTRPRSRACRSSTQQLEKHAGPVIASTDYMKIVCRPDPRLHAEGPHLRVLGTDGFGRSDFRTKLREHFEVDRHYIVVAALKALADEGSVPAAKVAEAIEKYGIDADKINPLTPEPRRSARRDAHNGDDMALSK